MNVSYGMSCPRFHYRTSILCLSTLATLLSLAVCSAQNAGQQFYGPIRPGEAAEYPRLIRLEHNVSVNGTLLGTFEHRLPEGTPGYLVILKSRDDGNNWTELAKVNEPNGWSTMWQPFLLELPKAVGKFPAGTILLMANSTDRVQTRFYLYSSADGGKSWSPGSLVTSSQAQKAGIWEPFLMLDAFGKLVVYFSDERQKPNVSQFLGGYVFDERRGMFDTDHELVLAESSASTDRPGMITIAAVPGPRYVAAFEVCTSLRVAHCPVHLKISSDGRTWEPGIGQGLTARDGSVPYNNPFLTWSSAGGKNGQLSLISEYTNEAFASTILINQDPDFRNSAWEWMPRPYFVPAKGQYSADLLPSENGRQIRLTGNVRPFLRTASASSGALPFEDALGSEGEAGWLTFGGAWKATAEGGDGIYTDAGGPGSKAVAGATVWNNYTLKSDVRLNGPGQAGVLVRVSNPVVGTDALNGYFIGINPSTHRLFAGREDGGWTGLATTAVDGITTDHWYTLTVTAVGADFNIVLTEPASGTPLARLAFQDAHFASGAIGLRDHNTSASWRHISVSSSQPIHPDRAGKIRQP